MQLGNSITLEKVDDDKQRLFKVETVFDFVQAVSALAHHIRNGRIIHLQFLSKDKFKLASIRAAYFIYLRDLTRSADCNGESIEDLHKAFKAKYLLPILCREDQEFADLVLRETKENVVSDIVIRLLSIADSSITTSKIMGEYFEAVQRDTH